MLNQKSFNFSNKMKCISFLFNTYKGLYHHLVELYLFMGMVEPYTYFIFKCTIVWRSALFWKIIKFIFCNAPRFFDKLVNLVLWVECIIKIGTCIFHCIIYGCKNLDKWMLWCEDASKLHIYGLICLSRWIIIEWF